MKNSMAIDWRQPADEREASCLPRMGRPMKRRRAASPHLGAGARTILPSAGDNEDAAMAQAASRLLDLTRSAFRIRAGGLFSMEDSDAHEMD